MYSPTELRQNIIIPTLRFMGFTKNEDVIELLVATCAHESHMGTYIRQIDGGPAEGIYQMEPNTADDVWENVLNPHPQYRERMCAFTDDLQRNPYYATAMARMQYWRFPEAVPSRFDVSGMAMYWKKYYNTIEGQGTVESFIHNYGRLVKNVENK